MTDDELIDRKWVVCCCSPEIPHGEGLKFSMLYKNADVLEQRLFPQGYKSEIETVSPLPEYLRPPFVAKKVYGRHAHLQELVQLMASNKVKHRLIAMSGPAGIGKSTIAKVAAMYAFERRIFADGVVYLDFKGRKDVKSLYENIATELDIPGISAKELCRQIDKLQLLIVLDSLGEMSASRKDKLEAKLRNLVETTYYPKIVVISRVPVAADLAFPYPVPEISKQDALKMFKELVGDPHEAKIE
jgi:hypothetical protein